MLKVQFSNEIDQTELLQPLINSRNFQSAQYNFHLLHIVVYLNTNFLFCFTLIFVKQSPLTSMGTKAKCFNAVLKAVVLCNGWLWTSWRGPAENWVGECEGCCVGTWSTGSLSWETNVQPAVEYGCSIISPHRTGSYCRWSEETPLFQMKGTVGVWRQFLVSLFKKENGMNFMIDW